MSLLNSTYVIDGVRQELTPAQLVSALLADGAMVSDGPSGSAEELVDESFDAPIADFPSGQAGAFLKRLPAVEDMSVLPSFPESYGRLAVATALIDALRLGGSFKLRDLALTFEAGWHSGDLGAASAFYALVASVCDYTDSLGLQFSKVVASDAGGREYRLSIGTSLLPPASADIPEMYRSLSPHISNSAACPDTAVEDESSWVVYIPFDTAEPRLGGSLLAKTLGGEFDVAPLTGDADYFIDCFEVVRELVEDGVVLAARTVGRGGLLPALDAFCGGNAALDADISDILRASEDNNPFRVLYSEIPGILIQIKDLDFDYLDAELLLQEVVFYPMGHPSRQGRRPGVRLKSSGRSGIQTILESLIRNAEGED